MIISKTPMRISFFGGGSDYPIWFKEHKGAVLSTTIDKYTYISARYLPPFFEHKYRVVWSQIENVNNISDIYHPAVRECLRFLNISEGLAVNHDGDLPAASGMGTSSTFTVGLLNALHHLKKEPVSNIMLGREAIYVEQQLIKNAVGNQDQLAAAIGGLNIFEFLETETCPPEDGPCGFQMRKLEILPERKRELESWLMLMFTGKSRNAGEIAQTYQFDKGIMRRMYQMVFEAESCLYIGTMKRFGNLLHEGWELKKRLSPAISSSYTDYLYEKAREAGAIGGKLLGAGGGGFLLLCCDPEKQDRVKMTFPDMIFVSVKCEERGTHILINGGTNAEV